MSPSINGLAVLMAALTLASASLGQSPDQANQDAMTALQREMRQAAVLDQTIQGKTWRRVKGPEDWRKTMSETIMRPVSQDDWNKLEQTVRLLEDDVHGILDDNDPVIDTDPDADDIFGDPLATPSVEDLGAFWLPDADLGRNTNLSVVCKSITIGTNSQWQHYDFHNVTNPISDVSVTNLGAADGQRLVLFRWAEPSGVPTLQYGTLDMIAGATNRLEILEIGGYDYVAHKTSELTTSTDPDPDGTAVTRVYTDQYGHLMTNFNYDFDERYVRNAAGSTNTLPQGTNNYDMLYWYDGAWTILPFAITNYTVLQRKGNGTLGWDYVRTHN